MLKIFDSQFLAPNKEYKKLALLSTIDATPDCSQHYLGRVTSLSSSMVNNYIKTFKNDALITVSGETNRSVSYHLTEKGKKFLSSTLLVYSAEVIQIYGTIKREIEEILKEHYSNGVRSVVFFGISETAEVVYTALKNTEIKISGVVDSDKNKQGKTFNGLIIEKPENISKLKPDGLLITSFAKQEEIYSIALNLLKKNKLSKNIKIIRISEG